MKETYKFQYEKWHQDTPESRKADIRGSSEFIDMHGLWPKDKEKKIFDIGCGMGRLLLAFRSKGFINLKGIDIDDYQIKIAKREKIRAELIGAEEYFTKNKEQQGLVMMIDCLEHIDKEKQIKLLNDIYKCLEDDGTLLIRVPNALSPSFACFRYIVFTHKLAYTEESLGYILKNAGFKYIVFRPAWEESKEIAELKSDQAKLLKAEFGMDNPILTSNLVAVAFKTKKSHDNYLKNSPVININYTKSEKMTWRDRIAKR